MGNLSDLVLIWSRFAFGVAGVLLILALGTGLFRKHRGASRWKDPAWIVWVLAAILFLGSGLECSGALGQGGLEWIRITETLGLDGAAYPVFWGSTLGVVLILGPVTALLTRRYPGLVLCLAVFLAVKASVHVVIGLGIGAEAGVAAGLLLSLPIGLWTIYISLDRELMGTAIIGKSVLLSVLYLAALSVLLVLGNRTGSGSPGVFLGCILATGIIFALWIAEVRHIEDIQ